jgi:hypothetical protein
MNNDIAYKKILKFNNTTQIRNLGSYLHKEKYK